MEINQEADSRISEEYGQRNSLDLNDVTIDIEMGSGQFSDNVNVYDEVEEGVPTPVTSEDTDDSFNCPTATDIELEEEELLGGDHNNPGMTTSISPEPYIGLEFADEEEAYNYYNMYAKEKGFSVRKGRVERSRIDRRVLSRAFVCSNEGSKYTKDKRRMGKDYQPRASKKTNCHAAMRVKAIHERWVVDIVVLEHNHELVDPTESFRLRSHQKANKGSVQLIERLRRCGVTPSKIFTILNEFAGGENQTGISDVRLRSLFRASRKKNLGIDCQLAVNYLDSKRTSDPQFFYRICVNKDQELTGLFWVDGRARDQYRIFGDVIVFDTTYRKNKFKFPFAPFTGVNHHMQCILFGCGLIADETKESFEWLFKTWLQAMDNIHPKAILTDEDPGIMRAIKKVFPSAVHRLCAWHLEKHRLTHLGPLFRKFPDFKRMFYNCLHKSTTPSEFESSWGHMVSAFNLENNRWLQKKYKIREHWVPCYFPNTFFAGMTTTQRAESMNNYFKGYFSSSTPINEFITQYEEAVKKRRVIEAKADVTCLTTQPPCATTHPLELHAVEVYTLNVFNVFKEEWKQCLGVEIRQCVMVDTMKRYETNFATGGRQNIVHFVDDDVEAEVTTCTCKMFEHIGVFCRHILKVYVISDRRRIPERYILPRWTKAARYSTNIGISNAQTAIGQAQQPVWLLQDLARQVVSEGSLSEERFGVTMRGLTDLLKDVMSIQASVRIFSHESTQPTTSTTGGGSVQRAMDPRNQTVTRGRPNISRVTGILENVHPRRSYHCSACGRSGHNVVKCPQVIANGGECNVSQHRDAMHIDLNDPPTQEDYS